jgi:hypothetical protein
LYYNQQRLPVNDNTAFPASYTKSHISHLITMATSPSQLGHCRAQHHALEYYSTGATTMVIPETMLSEAQEYDWAACYDEIQRWHTPEPESTHEQGM